MQDEGFATSKPTIPAALGRGQAAQREQIMATMLALSGELGYRRATVQAVIERSGVPRSHFYAHFAGKEDCFAAAYEAAAKRLRSALIDAAHSRPVWREALSAALQALFAFVSSQPLIARAILCEVYVARGPALARHEEVLEHLGDAINAAIRASRGVSHPPPPLAVSFMVGGIEQFVCSHLAKGKPGELSRALPELMRLSASYLGEDAAASARIALENSLDG